MRWLVVVAACGGAPARGPLISAGEIAQPVYVEWRAGQGIALVVDGHRVELPGDSLPANCAIRQANPSRTELQCERDDYLAELGDHEVVVRRTGAIIERVPVVGTMLVVAPYQLPTAP